MQPGLGWHIRQDKSFVFLDGRDIQFQKVISIVCAQIDKIEPFFQL
jgi:hypothetical protein